MIAFLYLLFVGLGFGVSAWRLLGIEEEDGVAAAFACFGTGLCVFVVLSAVLGYLGMINWVSYLVLAVLMLAVAYRDRRLSIPKISVNKEWAIVLALFMIHLYVYYSGAMSYPWLEDDDPWEHASGTRYISDFGTFIQPEHLPIHYIAPYPPFFDVLLAVLFQLQNDSLQFILKFFNAFLVSCTIPLFYIWAKRKLDGGAALWAAGILAALPCFMSHFIWSQTLAMFFVVLAFYFIERALSEGSGKKGYGILASASIAAVTIMQLSTAAMFLGMVGLYLAAKGMMQRGLTEELRYFALICAFGGVLALVLFWGPMLLMYGPETVLGHNLIFLEHFSGRTVDTSGGIVYGIMDYIIAPSSSKMDQPTGFGLAVFALLAAGAFMAAKRFQTNGFMAVLLIWLAYGVIGTEGNALPFKLFPHRFWVFLALPVAMLAGIGAVAALEYAGKGGRYVRLAAAIAVMIAILITSAEPKAAVETSMWPPGVSWSSNEQIAGYIGLKELPANTKVFSFCGKETLADGMGLQGIFWDKNVSGYKNKSISDSADGNHKFLMDHGYQYAVIDSSCLETNTPEEINSKLGYLSVDSRFQPMEQYSGNAFFVYKLY